VSSNKSNTKPSATKPTYTHMYMHVQISNEGARKFYEYHGFKEVRIHKDYYKKIEPRDAWVLELDLSEYQPHLSS
jgi:ribosomal protein S18 acetylase RimI-like enzyme